MCSIRKLLLVQFVVLISQLIFPVLSKIEYALENVSCKTSDPNLCNAFLRPQRVSRGVYGVFGNVTLGMDLPDNMTMGIKIYRSALGNNQYQLMPFNIANQTLAKIMDGVYKQMLMEEVGRCAKTFPQFEKWVGPVKKGAYIMNGCKADTKNLPPYFHPGFYKFQLYGDIPNKLLAVCDIVYQVTMDYSKLS